MSSTTVSSLVVILFVAAMAPILSDLIAPRLLVPTVVLELVGGILIGPVFDIASEDDIISFLAALGLTTLMFLAGLEIDMSRIRGGPLQRAIGGWVSSLALGLGIGFALTPVDGTRSGLIVGLAITTTALSTLLPILGDSGELQSEFGTEVLAGAAVGELGPLIAISVLLSTDRPARTVLVLVAFIVVVLVASALAMRPRSERLAPSARADDDDERPARRAAGDALRRRHGVGRIGAGTGRAPRRLRGRHGVPAVLRRRQRPRGCSRRSEAPRPRVRLLRAGLLHHQRDALRSRRDPRQTGDPLAVPAFLLAFIVVRGMPAFFIQHRWPTNDRLALACYLATELPLVVVITDIGVQTGRLKSSTSAALVAAAMVSVLTLPLVAARLRAPVTEP